MHRNKHRGKCDMNEANLFFIITVIGVFFSLFLLLVLCQKAYKLFMWKKNPEKMKRLQKKKEMQEELAHRYDYTR